jgi:hypothetical protein
MTDESGGVYAPLQGRSGRPHRRDSPAAPNEKAFQNLKRSRPGNVHGLFYVRNMFFWKIGYWPRFAQWPDTMLVPTRPAPGMLISGSP